MKHYKLKNKARSCANAILEFYTAKYSKTTVEKPSKWRKPGLASHPVELISRETRRVVVGISKLYT